MDAKKSRLKNFINSVVTSPLMNTSISWQEIAVRLSLTFVAGTLIGLNRGEQGRPVGVRTTLLVCLAASVSMIQVNLLLPMAGKNPNSFAVMDLMRLPLGILSGMGFIGGGAILRKGKLTAGVTTAATLWFVTVIGLCLGGGQIVLGMASLGLALFILSIMKGIERKLVHKHRGLLIVSVARAGASEEALTAKLQSQGLETVAAGRTVNNSEGTHEYSWQIAWFAKYYQPNTPKIIDELGLEPGIRSVRWLPDLPSEV